VTRIGVDALNLRADTRGMGRYVRPILQTLAAQRDPNLTLLVRDENEGARLQALFETPVHVAHIRTARTSGAYDVVWYPWNAMRFPSGAPTLLTVNDDFAFSFPARDFIARRREQAPIARGVRRATAIATISQWAREQIARRFGRDRATIGVIPLFPSPFFSPGNGPSPYAEPFVLAVGGDEARKNIAFLVNVFTQAFPNGDVRLVVVGSVDAATARVIGTSVVPIDVLPNCDDERLRLLYRSAAVVAVPSLAEGFGLVAVEAQACGAAVIAANTSALPEAVGDAGLLIDVTDRDAWVSALREVVRDDALRSRLGARGLARWASPPEHDTASAVLALLNGLVHDRA
jgi:glycosyltransferase involved in cell wall biosynthesis